MARATQIRIVTEVDRRLSIIREVEVEADTDTKLELAQALQQAALANAFSILLKRWDAVCN